MNLAEELRISMHEHAAEAPPGGDLLDRVRLRARRPEPEPSTEDLIRFASALTIEQ